MAKLHYTYTCIKSSKEIVCCVWKNIARLLECLHVMMIWDMRKSIQLTHNHNCLKGTITFEVHPMTPTSLRNTLVIIYKAFRFFLLLFFFAYFSFVKYIMHEHIRERRKYLIMSSFWHCTFTMPKHTNVISWLADNSGEMIIYAFLFGFSSPTYQKEWYEC